MAGTRRLWTGIVLVCCVFLLVSCDRIEQRQAAEEAEEDLRVLARLKGVEVTELEVSILDNAALTPADRANGIEGRATLILSYAWRCPTEKWRDDDVFYYLTKQNGSWQSDPDVRDPKSLPDFGEPLFACDRAGGGG